MNYEDVFSFQPISWEQASFAAPCECQALLPLVLSNGLPLTLGTLPHMWVLITTVLHAGGAPWTDVPDWLSAALSCLELCPVASGHRGLHGVSAQCPQPEVHWAPLRLLLPGFHLETLPPAVNGSNRRAHLFVSHPLGHHRPLLPAAQSLEKSACHVSCLVSPVMFSCRGQESKPSSCYSELLWHPYFKIRVANCGSGFWIETFTEERIQPQPG